MSDETKNPINSDMSFFIKNAFSEGFSEPTAETSFGIKYADPSQVDKFTAQKDFDSFGFNPQAVEGNTQRKIDSEDWGSTMSKAFNSFGYKFGNTFTDYWKDYGRMGDALIHMDWDRMKPDESTMIDTYYQDQIDANRNYVFQDPKDEDSFFTKRTAADFISNSGFALGTMAGMFLEVGADIAVTALSGGTAAPAVGASVLARLGAKLGAKKLVKEGVEEVAKNSFKLKDVFKGFEMGNRTKEELEAGSKVLNQIDEAFRASNTFGNVSRVAEESIAESFNIFSNNLFNIKNSKNLLEGAGNVLKGTPLLGTGIRNTEKIIAAAKGGANGAELFGMGLQGVRRIAQELNMSGTEASFEAVTSYGDTLTNMVERYKNEHNSEPPDAYEFDRMKHIALKASSSNYNTNLGLLMATNKLQFGNLFNKFSPANRFAREFLEESSDKVLDVITKSGSKTYIKPGFWGTYGLTGKIAKDFGKKEAIYQFGKSFLKDFGKFELTEGLQENLQEASGSAWKSYYTAQYENTERSLKESFGDGIQEQFTKQGLKTFMLGALTGSVIRIPTVLGTKIVDKFNNKVIDNQYKDNPSENPLTKSKNQLIEDVDVLNSTYNMFKNRSFSQKIFNFNNQMNTSNQMNEAAGKNLRYEFENSRDNALLSAVMSAKRTNSVSALSAAIRNMGVDMTNEDFEKTFNVKLEDTKYKSPKEFADNVAKDVEKYSKVFDDVKNRVGNFVNPASFEEGSLDREVANHFVSVQYDAIQTIALNAIKGEMSSKRASQIASELSSSPLSTVSSYVLDVLSKGKLLNSEIGHIESELRVLNDQLKDITDNQFKKDTVKKIQEKEKELELLVDWTNNFSTREAILNYKDDEGNVKEHKHEELDTFVGKKSKKTFKRLDENGVEVDETEDVYESHDDDVIALFTKIVNLKNQQGGKDAIPDWIVRDNFSKVVDYMQLNQDTKDYMDSVNAISEPKKYKQMLERMIEGNFKANVMMYVDSLSIVYTNGMLDILNSLPITELANAEEISKELHDAFFESEAYKNIKAFTVNPKLGVANRKYISELQNSLQEIIKNKSEEILERFNNTTTEPETEDDEIEESEQVFNEEEEEVVVPTESTTEPIEGQENNIVQPLDEEIDSSKPIEVVQPQASSVGVGGGVNIVDSKSDDIIAELNKLKTPQEKLNWLKERGLITPIVIDGKSYNSIDYNDRIMVLAKIGKYNIPFYISTGQAGKKNVKAGNWYAIFGIGESGWINKGSEELINKQYDFPIFQKIAKILNEGVGNFESRENNGNGKIIEGIGYLKDSKSAIGEFNAQMGLPITPAKNNTESKVFYENVNNVLSLVNDELKNVTQSLKETPKVEKESDDNDSGTPDSTSLLLQQLGVTVEQDPTQEGFNIQDNDNLTVNPEPIKEEVAEETAREINTVRLNNDFVLSLLPDDVKDKSDELYEKIEKSLKASNRKNKIDNRLLFSEYYKSPNGFKNINKIKDSVLNNKVSKNKKEVKIETPDVNLDNNFDIVDNVMNNVQTDYIEKSLTKLEILENIKPEQVNFAEELNILNDLDKLNNCI